MATLWPICALLWLAIGISCDGSPTIVQTPQSVIQRPDSKVSLNCNINGGSNPNIYWYRQILKGQIQLLAYSVAVGSSSAEGPPHIQGSRPEDTKFFLSIKNLMANDTGIYYCAWSPHTVQSECNTSTKTLLLACGSVCSHTAGKWGKRCIL
uniref:T cell receptor beta variable 30 n=1 Tax=Podarcis muralis TaxID=64176 RepID=A0A670K071_PODMU